MLQSVPSAPLRPGEEPCGQQVQLAQQFDELLQLEQQLQQQLPLEQQFEFEQRLEFRGKQRLTKRALRPFVPG